MMLARIVGCWVAVAASAFAAVPPAPLSAKEIAQGYREHRILVRPRAGHESDADNAENRSRMRLHRRVDTLGGIRVLELDPTDSADAAIERLKATGHYASVEPDRLRHAFSIPNDPSFSQQWSLQNTGQSGGTSGADIAATTGWSTRSDASSVILAVVDSGIRYTHEDLSANMWSNSSGYHGINAILATNVAGYNDPNDDQGHGTHVAGIAGAVGNNGVGIAGVAWKAKLMALKFIPSDGSGNVSDEIECIDYAITNGAKVINASYGSDGSSDAEMQAIARAQAHDIVFVAAAGNGTNDDGVPVNNDTTPMYPADYALDNIVAVAATNRNDVLSDFSNYGGMVDLAAPGEEITSTYNASNSSYQTFSGTSMAAPHVSGVVALLRAQFPNENYHQIINRLLRGVTKVSSLTGKTATGGRLNLAQALGTTTNTPFNDNFADRAMLTGPNARARSNNVGATLESGEPTHAGATGGHSLWWSWTASDNAQVVFDTSDSVNASGNPLDTTLAVYTGTSLAGLTAVGSNDDNAGLVTSRLTLNVTAGTTYQIAVDGKNGATGLIVLRIGSVPKNDNFANATTLTGQSATISATLLNASSESGEPRATSNAAGHSVWYSWTAPTTAHYEVSAFAPHIDTVLAVYTGSAVNALTQVASNDNGAANNSDALVGFTANAGTTYYFQVDHTTVDQSSGGDFVLTLNDSPWEAAVGDEVTSSPAVGPDGTIYFGTGSANKYDTNVYAVTATGSRRWNFATTLTGVMDATPAVSPSGVVYIGGSDKILYALDAASGAKKWSYTAGTAISSTPALASDGTVYFRDDTKLYALSSTGTLKWTFDLGSTTTGTYCSPAVGADGTIYLGTNAGAFYALKPDGTKKWSFTANDGVTTPGDGDIYTTPAIGADGTIYFANLYGTVYALTDSGTAATKKWTWSTSDHSSITSSIAIAADGTLYFAGYDHKLHALSSSGTEKWSFTLGDQVRASSPVIAVDGTVYVGCYDQLVYAVTSAGALKRTYATAKPIRSSPVIANNRLYIGCADAKLYAFDIGQGAMGSAWPMKHRNPGRTGAATTSSISIGAQPLSQSVTVGSAFALSVSATTTGTTDYQWYKDGAAIAGATSSS